MPHLTVLCGEFFQLQNGLMEHLWTAAHGRYGGAGVLEALSPLCG